VLVRKWHQCFPFSYGDQHFAGIYCMLSMDCQMHSKKINKINWPFLVQIEKNCLDIDKSSFVVLEDWG
jgi:hypothetical protein